MYTVFIIYFFFILSSLFFNFFIKLDLLSCFMLLSVVLVYGLYYFFLLLSYLLSYCIPLCMETNISDVGVLKRCVTDYRCAIFVQAFKNKPTYFVVKWTKCGRILSYSRWTTLKYAIRVYEDCVRGGFESSQKDKMPEYIKKMLD